MLLVEPVDQNGKLKIEDGYLREESEPLSFYLAHGHVIGIEALEHIRERSAVDRMKLVQLEAGHTVNPWVDVKRSDDFAVINRGSDITRLKVSRLSFRDIINPYFFFNEDVYNWIDLLPGLERLDQTSVNGLKSIVNKLKKNKETTN